MIYSSLNDSTWGLKLVGLLAGGTLVATHTYAKVKALSFQVWLKSLPRHHSAGVVLLSLSTAWVFFLLAGGNLGFVSWPPLDLGEFHTLRTPLLIGLPIGCFLVARYVDEFLFPRALGALAMLLASVMLDAAFLREITPHLAKLLIPLLAYAAIIASLFWVGIPYVFRDQIEWASATRARWNGLCLGGIVYGILLILSALLFY
ncbi:MAG: hypothetical protein AAF555_04695 [Verrucomicrobiota bacterium]